MADAALSVADLKPETGEAGARPLLPGRRGILEGVEAERYPRSVTMWTIASALAVLTLTPRWLFQLCRFQGNSRGRRVSIFRYYNVNKARIQGVETELKFRLTRRGNCR